MHGRDRSPAPPAGVAARPLRWLPRTLFGRVTLIVVLGLAVAQLLTFAAVRYERGVAMKDLMMTGIELDIASSVAVIDRLPAAERGQWLGRLERPNYRFEIGDTVQGIDLRDATLRDFADSIATAVRPFSVLRRVQAIGVRQGVDLLLRLGDGSRLVVHARRVERPISAWVLWALVLQFVVLGACAWVVVRLVTRPLAQLATAADELGPDLRGTPLQETGPTEVARAAHAFNAMQGRIAGYMNERVEILAAISHDLQTPLTRLRLRVALLEGEADRDKFLQDIQAMQALVREGLAYARTLHGVAEPPARLDVDALLQSLAGDYADTGQPLRVEGAAGRPIVTRPLALRRILVNLMDNALKFGGDVCVQVRSEAQALVIAVNDDGPGIPPDQLEAVLRPFYRIEGSRNRSSGGTGLGLSIAHQLSTTMGARLQLLNRPEGGLEARLTLPPLDPSIESTEDHAS